MLSSNKIIKLSFFLALAGLASFFIYNSIAGPMKINTQDTNRLTSGLVGYWTFDGQDTNWGTNTTNDRSGNGYNGTMTNMSTTTSPAPGVIGQALNFDGNNDKVNLGTPASLSLTGPLSISAWVYPRDLNNYQEFISSFGQYNFAISGSSLRLYENNIEGSAISPANSLSINQWQYVTAVVSGTKPLDPSTIKLYINGVSQTITASGIWDPSGTITSVALGERGNGYFFYNGFLDEVRIYNRALSASEITELYQQGQTKINASQGNKLTSGLVGYWTFDGQDTNWGTNTTNDRSGNGYNGTMTNMSTSTSPVPGVVGQAFSFNGSSSNVSLGATPNLNFLKANSFSVSSWVKRNDAATGNQTIINNWNSINGAGWVLRFSNNKITLMLKDTAENVRSGTTSADYTSTSDWYYITATYNGTATGFNIYIYINGQSVGIATSDAMTGDATYIAARIGARTDNNFYFNGLIDEVRIYNRALAANEITELYQQGQTKINASQANKLTSGLVGYWTFDGQDTNWGTNTTNDRSGNGYNGTMTNMSTTTSPAPGVVGQALNFDGSDDLVDTGTGSSISFDRYNPFSVSVWVKRGSITANTNYSIIGDYDNSTDTGWHLKFNDTNAILLAFIKNNVMVNYTSTNNTSFTSTTNWYHIIATYDGSNTASGIKIYVDGASENVTPTGGTLDSFANSTSGTIGKGKYNGTNNLLFNGSIDEVRIYNRALSASEVTELYNQGR